MTRAFVKRGWLLVALAFGACAQDAPDPPTPSVPDVEAEVPPPTVAPDFDLTLPLLGGGTFRTEDYRGRVVLLNLWATWCPPCREEIPDLIALREALHARDFEVVGIAMDLDPEVVPPFVEEFAIPYPIAFGTQETTAQIGGAFGLPVSLLLDREGQLVRRFVGLISIEEVQPLIEELLAPA